MLTAFVAQGSSVDERDGWIYAEAKICPLAIMRSLVIVDPGFASAMFDSQVQAVAVRKVIFLGGWFCVPDFGISEWLNYSGHSNTEEAFQCVVTMDVTKLIEYRRML